MLNPPPKDLHRQALATKVVDPAALHRISRHNSAEPYFGRSGALRFDDTNRIASRRYGTCYCGFDLETALAESVLHDEEPVQGRFRLSKLDFDRRFLIRFAGTRPLVLADLTGIALKRMGGNGAISSITPYDLPQAWAKAIHRHPRQVDGIYYVSRHLNTRFAVAAFDRAAAAFGAPTYTQLSAAPGVARAKRNLGLSFPFP